MRRKRLLGRVHPTHLTLTTTRLYDVLVLSQPFSRTIEKLPSASIVHQKDEGQEKKKKKRGHGTMMSTL